MTAGTNRQSRIIVVGIVVLAALLMIVYVPFSSFEMVNPILTGQLARIEKFTAEGNPQAPLLSLTTWLVSFFYPFWGTLSLIAGLTLLVIALPLYRGEPWTRGLALLALAVPSMGGAYMLVPWMNFVGSVQGGVPPSVTIMMIGLVPYTAILVAEKGDRVSKAANLLVFLMLGVTATENFANGHAAFRILYGHPTRPMFAEGIAITYFGWFTLWVGFGILAAAIYLLGARRASGWYAGLIGGLITIIGSGATHYVRHATNDYLYGALMGLAVMGLLLVPAFKSRLFDQPASETVKPKAAAQLRTA